MYVFEAREDGKAFYKCKLPEAMPSESASSVTNIGVVGNQFYGFSSNIDVEKKFLSLVVDLKKLKNADIKDHNLEV